MAGSGHGPVPDPSCRQGVENRRGPFQALRFEDEAIQEEIRSRKSPMAAKFVAKRNKAQMVVVPRSEGVLPAGVQELIRRCQGGRGAGERWADGLGRW